ncbi:MAG: DEAD/DEAH box helicase [Planctomycetota bacterium]|nr:MAG: DEAD/DEAH box helicase [Planctomycetota bacterium]
MDRLAEANQPLVRLRGRWIELRPEDFRAAHTFLRRHPRGQMPVREALSRCLMAEDLETGVPFAGLKAEGWVRPLLDATRFDERLLRVDQPRRFEGSLRPYQLRGLAWLVFLDRLGLGACLADEMGLGKTIQLIALWLYERESGTSPGPTLLIVPMSLVGNWQREIARFAPTLRVMVHHGMDRLAGEAFAREAADADVVICTYGLAHRDFEHLAAVDWHRIALDEAQNIKNPAAKQSIAVRALRARHRVALTGTPLENRLTELWSILDFLNPGYLGSGSEFRRRFAIPIERHRDEDRARRLRQLIRPFVLRRLKNDPAVAVDLPDKMEMKVYCNLTREQARLYESVVGDMLGQIDGAEGIRRRGLILAALVKLKQICNHPAHFLRENRADPHRSGKCERLVEMIDELLAEGDRALIFTQFREMGALLHDLFRERFHREVLFLHGGTPRAKRDEFVRRFQDSDDDVPLLILSLKTGGYGLNLTAAGHVFHVDRWWNPAVEDQATDRAHRIGQTRHVQVYKYVCVGTLEERIDALLEQKRNLADKIVGSGEDWLTELSTEKLREILTLSRDAVSEE